jgi:hypothetical protein
MQPSPMRKMMMTRCVKFLKNKSQEKSYNFCSPSIRFDNRQPIAIINAERIISFLF